MLGDRMCSKRSGEKKVLGQGDYCMLRNACALYINLGLLCVPAGSWPGYWYSGEEKYVASVGGATQISRSAFAVADVVGA